MQVELLAIQPVQCGIMILQTNSFPFGFICDCARQSLASTLSAPRVAATSYCDPGRLANVVTAMFAYPLCGAQCSETKNQPEEEVFGRTSRTCRTDIHEKNSGLG